MLLPEGKKDSTTTNENKNKNQYLQIRDNITINYFDMCIKKKNYIIFISKTVNISISLHSQIYILLNC